MKLTTRAVNAFNAFTGNKQEPVVKNSNRGTAADFLRYGDRHNALRQEWSQVEMSDQDMYTGYSYAAIKKRANRASALGKKFLYTEASDAVMAAAKKSDKELEHPYLKLIRTSKEFSRRKFWHDISTYLDLEGVYYLMAVRAITVNAQGETKVGAIQKFQMLNPYQVRRVTKQSDGTLGGYIESKDGMYREIPKEMIIEVRLLNPFDNDLPFSMTDAAKESQFTMKQAGDYTRHAIKGNIQAPGAISTGVELEDHEFDNFISRIQNHSKGEPLYGNGTGAINWNSMQIDLDKAGLDKINEINRSILFAVSGTSKTTLGIEESGTTRDTSQVQKDNFTEDSVMPQIEDILDALNLDYRKWYPEWEKDEYEISLDNPLATDREAELKDIEIREAELALRESLIGMGYEYEIANKYAHGDISLEELGEPTLEPELSDEEADAIAAKQLGQPAPETADEEPKKGNEVKEITQEEAANRVVATNKFVDPKHNEQKVKEAVKRRKAAPKNPDAKAKDEEAERADDAEDQSKKIIKGEEKKKKKTIVTVKLENNLEEKVVNQLAARDIEGLYDGLVVDNRAITDDKYRGCIMINTEVIPVQQFVKNAEADLVTEGDHTMGAVSEVEPHATLLYGLLNNGNIWKEKVDLVLEGWSMDTVRIKEVSFFDLGDTKAVIGLLEETPEIVEANRRLSLLPHLNTFSEYHPHVTLAYITGDADVEKWTKALGKKYNGQIVATKGINYGDAPVNEGNDDDDSTTKNHVEDEHRPSLNKDFYDELPGFVAIMLDDIASEYSHLDWFKDAWNEYRDHVMTASMDDMKMPGFVFGKYIDTKSKNSLDADFVKKKIEHKQQNSATSSPNELQAHDCDEHGFVTNSTFEKATNALDPAVKDSVILQEANLQNAVAGLEAKVVNAVVEALREGDIDEAERLISEAQEEGYIAELALLFAGFFLVLFPIYAAQLFMFRLAQFGVQGIFAMTDDISDYIEKSARAAAESHIQTIINDLRKTIEESREQITRDNLIKEVTDKVNQRDPEYMAKLPTNPSQQDIVNAVDSGKFDSDPAYKLARDKVREGEGLREITKAIQNKYTHIAATRAKTIARHESSRVFNMSQYQADLQFLKESNNLDRAYKRLRSRTNEPCAVCHMLIDKTTKDPIPFAKNFADLGDELTATFRRESGKMAVQKMAISYEAIKAGNVHVNCNCEYELVIKNDDGTFQNELDERVTNAFDPNQKRDKDGKWTDGTPGVDSKTGMGKVDLSGKLGINMDFAKAKEDAQTLSRFDFIAKYLTSHAEPEKFAAFIKTGLKGELSEDEEVIKELLSYQGNSQHINRHLAEHPDSRFIPNMTKDLDKAFTMETTKPVVTYRKIGKDYYNLAEADEGYRFTEPNYGSTTLNPREANSEAWGDGPILVIDVPKGQKVAIPDLYSGTVDELSIFGQQEVLLPRATEYEVIDKVRIPDSNDYMVRVRIVKP